MKVLDRGTLNSVDLFDQLQKVPLEHACFYKSPIKTDLLQHFILVIYMLFF